MKQTKIKTFYGVRLAVEEQVNEFLTKLAANDRTVVDIKQSLDNDNEVTGTYVLYTVIYKINT